LGPDNNASSRWTEAFEADNAPHSAERSGQDSQLRGAPVGSRKGRDAKDPAEAQGRQSDARI